jgi:uncharacterized membrane protein YphA (DoxX/SURF4 family)
MHGPSATRSATDAQESGQKPKARWTRISAYAAPRSALALLFLIAGGSKLFELDAFAQTISDFGIVPDASVGAVALFISSFEIVAAIGLLLDRRGALTAIAGLIILFMGVLAYGLHLGLEIDCGCFGPGETGLFRHSLGEALAFDAILIVLCGYLVVCRRVLRVHPGPIWPIRSLFCERSLS